MAPKTRALPWSTPGVGLLTAAIEICPQPLAIAREGVVLWCNAAFACLFGYATPGELHQFKLARLFPPGHACPGTAPRNSPLESFGCGFPGCEFQGMKKNGDRVLVEGSCRWFSVEGKPALMISARDMSQGERRRVSREGPARFRAIFEASAMGIAHCTLGGLLVETNRALQRMLGYAPQELNGRHYSSITHSDDAAALSALYQQIISGSREHGQLEQRFLRHDGEWLWGRLTLSLIRSPAGEPLFTMAMVEDASEQKRAQQALLRSEQRFRALVEHSSDALVLLDEQGKTTYTSNLETLGYSGDEPLDPFDVVHADDLPAVRAAFQECLNKPGEAVTLECRARHKDGSWHELECVAVNRLAMPEVAAVVVDFRDISGRKRIERQLREAQRLETVGRLVGGIAHDFNSLLTAIMLYCDLMLSGLAPRHPGRRHAEEIRSASERGAALVQQLLSFARQQVVQPRLLALNSVLRSMENMLRRLIGQNIALSLDLAGDAGSVLADPSQMQQLVLNLVLNARDAMPEGGELQIATRMAEEPGHAGPLRWVELEVCDNGCGMDAETRAHLFEPFFTTKKGRGSGLGLATVQNIVQGCRGRISVASEPGRGTQATVRLPQAGPALTEPVAPAAPAVRGGRETILLAEDDAAVRAAARRVLAREGYRVVAASNGAEALRALHKHAGRLDLVLADLIMPRMSGAELVRQVRALRPEVKALYISGYSDASHLGKASAGDDVLLFRKPFTGNALLAKVREALGPSVLAGEID